MRRSFDKSIIILLMLVVVLVGVSIFVIANERSNEIVYTDAKLPKLVIKKDIVFDIDPNTIENKCELLDEIVDLDSSVYDKLSVLECNTTKIGSRVGKLEATLGDMEIIKNFKYEVVDNEAPVINQRELFKTTVGKKIDFLSYLTVDDNSLRDDETITPKVEGSVNFDKAGVYRVRVSATDAAGNETFYMADVTVEEVIIPQPQPQPQPTPTPQPQPQPTPTPTPDPTPEPDTETDPDDNDQGSDE